MTKKILLGMLILGLVYTVAMESFLTNDFGYYETAPIIIEVYPDGGVNESSASSPFFFSKKYLFQRSVFDPFYQLGTLIHLKRTYYVCFEGYNTPLIIKESKSENWFGSNGYYYHQIENFVGDSYEYQQNFYDNFPIEKNITSAKLTKSSDCSNYEKIKPIFEYKVQINKPLTLPQRGKEHKIQETFANEIIESELTSLTRYTKLADKYQLARSSDRQVYTIWLYTKEKSTKEELENIGTQIATALTEKHPEYYYTFIIFPDTSVKQVGDFLPYDSYQTFYWEDGQIIFGTE